MTRNATNVAWPCAARCSEKRTSTARSSAPMISIVISRTSSRATHGGRSGHGPVSSLITLAVLVALGKGEEFQMHVRAAINNGVTRDQIKELIMHTAIYCGMPAAHGAFHIAETTFAAMDAERSP